MSIILKKLRIRNMRTYGSQDLELDNRGVVSMQGVNGSGKSTVWHLIEALIYGTTPSGHSKDELTMYDKDASLELDLSRSNVDYTAGITRKKGKWTYSLKGPKDAEFTQKHRSEDTGKEIRRLFWLTRPEFNGSVLLNQNAMHVLILGKPAERKKYISDFFGIDSRFDQVLDEVKAEITRAESEISKLSGFAQNKQLLLEEFLKLNPEDPGDYEVEHTTIQSKIAKVRLEDAEFANDLKTWNQFDTWNVEASRFPNAAQLIPDAEAKIAKIVNIISDNKKAVTHNKLIKEQIQKKDELELELLKYESVKGLEQSKVITRYHELTGIESAYLKNSQYRKELSSLTPPLKKIDTDVMQSSITRLQSEVYSLRQKITAISSGNCPTCGSSFRSEDLTKFKYDLEEKESDLESLSADLKVLQKKNQVFDRCEQLKDFLKNDVEFSQDMRSELLVVEDQLSNLQKREKVKHLLEQFKNLNILEEVDTSDLESQLSELQQSLTLIRSSYKAQMQMPAKLPAINRDGIESGRTKFSVILNNLNSESSRVSQVIGTIRAEIRQKEKFEKQIAELDEQLVKLPDLRQELMFWEKMEVAYGPKGIRLKQLKSIMDMVLERLPYYVSKMFNEKGLRFKHECDAGNIEIFAIREGPEQAFWHDIATMSGGEQKKLSVCLVLTLAECVSSQKRTNLITLDEIDANLDEQGRYMFVNELLPALKQHYSSIFIISHSPDIERSGVFNEIWRVHKENHSTKIDIRSVDEINSMLMSTAMGIQ